MMRYLGAFPTEEELVHDILPKLAEEEEAKQIKYSRFEPFMVKTMVERNYEPDNEDVLLQAFKVLDPQNKEYIEDTVMVEYLTSNEWGFRDKEKDEFLKLARDEKTSFIHYEDYIMLLTSTMQ